jgi:hypothetical protein
MRLLGIKIFRPKCRHLSSIPVIVVFSLVIGLFGGDTELLAQEISTGGHWQFTPSISLYQQYSDNIDLSFDEPVGAMITEISPGFLFKLPSPRKEIRITTNLKMDYRSRDDGIVESLYWYEFSGYLGHQYSPRTAYELDMGYDIYYTEVDLGSPFVNVFGALTRSDVFYIKPGLRYNVTKTTIARVGLKYGFSTYADPSGVDGENIEGELYVTQRLGSRISVGTGMVYRSISYANATGYTESEIPVEVSMDLTYTLLKIKTAFVSRSYEESAGPGEAPFVDETFFLYGLGFELGGQLLKLRSTTLELNFENNYHDDMYGNPYENQEIRLSAYHAFKKFDFYTDLKFGSNAYTQTKDTISYYGTALGLKWFISNKSSMNFTADYNSYSYDVSGVSSSHDIISTSLDYSYNLYDWLSLGVAGGHRQSSSDLEEGNYTENLYSFFAKAVW